MKLNRRVKGAFSLVELLIVIIIIAVLAAIAIPKFSDASLRSKESALKADLRMYRNAVNVFKSDTGLYPNSMSALAATTAPAQGTDSAGNNQPLTASLWKGPYIEAINNDPVSGAAFTYSVTPPSVGQVKSSATGNASDGTAYSSW